MGCCNSLCNKFNRNGNGDAENADMDIVSRAPDEMLSPVVLRKMGLIQKIVVESSPPCPENGELL